MTVDLLFKIALFIVVIGIAIKLLKIVSGLVFKIALIALIILFFIQIIK